MQKIVINTCFGGFSLSPLAVKELAKLNGKKCFFFKDDFKGNFQPLTLEQASKGGFFTAFSVKNPNRIKNKDFLFDKYYLTARPENRLDPLLIKVVEKLKEKANGYYAQLKIVEVPDGIQWEIDDYDGRESVEEKHRSWS